MNLSDIFIQLFNSLIDDGCEIKLKEACSEDYWFELRAEEEVFTIHMKDIDEEYYRFSVIPQNGKSIFNKSILHEELTEEINNEIYGFLFN